MDLVRWITAPFRRDKRRPLSYRQPEIDRSNKVPLGLEAVDMSQIDAVNRRNGSLERVSTFFAPANRFGSFLEHAETRVPPLADDETYAARYHRAYNQKKGSQT